MSAWSAKNNGIFNMRVPVSITMIYDGTSNVIMASEQMLSGSSPKYDLLVNLRQAIAFPTGWTGEMLTQAQLDELLQLPK